MSPRGLRDWEEKLDFLLTEQATAVGPEEKFALKKKIEEARGRIAELRAGPTSPDSPDAYRSMAVHPDGFVERHQLDEIAALLTAEEAGVVGITTALRGAGGFGKTTLAQALAEDERVRRAYPDGVLWATMGAGLKTAERVSRVLDVIRFWDPDEKPAFDSATAAGARLRELLAGKKVLLVVDDIWSSADVEPFRGLGAGSALLITTRNRQTLPSECRRIDVDAMRRDEAVDLLTSDLDDADPVLFVSLAHRLGEWPLLLKLVNRQLRGYVEYGLEVPAAIGKVEELLVRGVDRLDVSQDAKREEAVRLTIQASLDFLSEDNQRRYLELAVFPKAIDVPLDAVARLWQLDAVETEDLSWRLSDLSLLLRLDLMTRALRLHDVFREYLLGEHEDQAKLHRTFLDRCRPPSGRWTDLAADDAYLWRHLAYHLEKAGERTTLRELLFDFGFLRFKLAATDVNALLADYDFFKDDEEARFVQGALRLSAHVLVRNIGPLIDQQLAGQLYGRLMGKDGRDARRLLRESARRIALRPRAASLAQAGGPLLRTLEGHKGPVSAVSTLGEHRVVSASLDQTLRVWNIATGDTIQTLGGHSSGLRAVASLNGNRIISAADDQTLRVWDVESGDTIKTLEGHTDWIRAVTILDENRVVSASDDKTLRVWDIEKDQEAKVLKGHTSGVSAVAILSENRVVSASLDQTLRIWDIESEASIQTLTGHEDGVAAVVALDEDRVVSASFDQTLRVWDVKSGNTVQLLNDHASGVTAVAKLDKNRVVSASFDQTLRIWNVVSGGTIRSLKGHVEGVTAVAVLDQDHVVSASLDRTLRIWDISVAETIWAPERHTSAVAAVAILDEACVVTASYDKTLRVWDIASGEAIGTLNDHTDKISGVAVLDENRIISSSHDQTLRIWDVASREVIGTLRGHTDEIWAVAVLDKSHVVSASNDQTLRIWDLASNEPARVLVGHTSAVVAVAVLDESHIVSASNDRTLRVWDVPSGKPTCTLVDHTGGVSAVAILDESRVVSASYDHTLRIWDVSSGKSISVLKGHSSEVLTVAVLDTNHIISASSDQTLRVWEVASGRNVGLFTLEAGIWSVAFVPGRRIVVAGDGLGGVHFLDFVETQPEEESEMGERNVPIDGDVRGATIMAGDVVVHQPTPSTKEPTSQVDAVLITAITREREAALAEFRAQKLDPVLTEHGGRYHHAFELEREGKKALRCLLAQPTEKGPHASQALVADLLRTFEPELVLLVGVAGGLDERGVGEGDIVVARRIYNYEPGRLKAGGLEERPEPYRASARLVDLANALDADGVFTSVLRGRRLHVRDYASGEKVLMDRDSELRHRILALSPDVYAFEMEGHGLLHSVWEAARELNVQCGVVKSVSDFGDESMREGKDERQREATRRAVGVTLELLRRF